MKRIISLILCLSIFSTSLMASPEEVRGIREAMREFNYALEVEWDQRDQNFYHAQVELFNERIEQLKLNNISKKEALTSILAEAKNGPFKNSVQELLKQIDIEKLPPQEVQNLFVELAQRERAKGANWIGDVEVYMPFILAFGAIVAITVLLVVLQKKSDEKSKKKWDEMVEKQKRDQEEWIKNHTPPPSENPTPTPNPTPGTDPSPTPTPEPTPAPQPTYQCDLKFICYGVVTENYFDPTTGQYLMGQYQDSCGYKFVCGTW